ncbi:unnamed protein product [Paramecium sonneborni]|uniref:Uncharacterized protein n=1 Tax=Paramecium sonneborni TaxID=65129 RepID=A0A8S1KYC3_9CILI|nr:unnamed protein product [Paramecium sonneborni]
MHQKLHIIMNTFNLNKFRQKLQNLVQFHKSFNMLASFILKFAQIARKSYLSLSRFIYCSPNVFQMIQFLHRMHNSLRLQVVNSTFARFMLRFIYKFFI